MTQIRITRDPGKWVVRIAGNVVGESQRVLRLREGELADVIYVPREDIAMAFFDRSQTRTTCPHKGEASYFHFVATDGTVPDVAWSYEKPLPGAAQIAGHLGFYASKAQVEEL